VVVLLVDAELVQGHIDTTCAWLFPIYIEFMKRIV